MVARSVGMPSPFSEEVTINSGNAAGCFASAVRTYVNRYGVRPGNRAVVFTNNDSAYRAALDAAGHIFVWGDLPVARRTDRPQRRPGRAARSSAGPVTPAAGSGERLEQRGK